MSDWRSNARPPRAESGLQAAVEDAIRRLGGYPDSRLDGDGGLAAAVMNDCARLERERDAAIAERDRLRAQLEEREADMHARIRASYDATVADCWRAAIAKVEAERDRLRAEVDVLRGVGCCEDRGPHEPPSGPCGVCIRCARAERDRLRRELEEWRESLAGEPGYWTVEVGDIRDRIDGILSGGEQ